MAKQAKTKAKAKTKPEEGAVDGVAPRSVRRAKRQQRVAKATNVTFTLDPAVRRFVEGQAKVAGMDLTHFMQKMVENHVIASAPEGDDLARRLAAKRHVIDYAVDLAKAMDTQGAFDEHFILNVVKKAEQDPAFVSDYTAATGEETEENARQVQRARVSLNQQIGRLVKKAAGARSKRNEKGAIARAQVQGALISTYTLLAKPA